MITGTSGAGKDTIAARLRERFPDLWWAVSMTNRSPRPGEVDGRDYLFVDTETFDRLRRERGFVEWFDVYGELKGTPRAPLEEALRSGRDVLMRKDVRGALAVKQQYPQSVVIFVKAPSIEEQRRRLEARGEGPERIALRLREDAAAEAMAGDFDHVVVNDDLDRAVEEIAAIIQARRDPLVS